MDLRTYIDREKLTPTQFAALIRVSVAAFHRYLLGERIPRPEIMERITTVTGGEVQPNDFYAFVQPNPSDSGSGNDGECSQDMTPQTGAGSQLVHSAVAA